MTFPLFLNKPAGMNTAKILEKQIKKTQKAIESMETELSNLYKAHAILAKKKASKRKGQKPGRKPKKV